MAFPSRCEEEKDIFFVCFFCFQYALVIGIPSARGLFEMTCIGS